MLPFPSAQVLQGVVWVFGEGGPTAFIEAAMVAPAAIPQLAQEPGFRRAPSHPSSQHLRTPLPFSPPAFELAGC